MKDKAIFGIENEFSLYNKENVLLNAKYNFSDLLNLLGLEYYSKTDTSVRLENGGAFYIDQSSPEITSAPFVVEPGAITTLANNLFSGINALVGACEKEDLRLEGYSAHYNFTFPHIKNNSVVTSYLTQTVNPVFQLFLENRNSSGIMFRYRESDRVEICGDYLPTIDDVVVATAFQTGILRTIDGFYKRGNSHREILKLLRYKLPLETEISSSRSGYILKTPQVIEHGREAVLKVYDHETDKLVDISAQELLNHYAKFVDWNILSIKEDGLLDSSIRGVRKLPIDHKDIPKNYSRIKKVEVGDINSPLSRAFGNAVKVRTIGDVEFVTESLNWDRIQYLCDEGRLKVPFSDILKIEKVLEDETLTKALVKRSLNEEQKQKLNELGLDRNIFSKLISIHGFVTEDNARGFSIYSSAITSFDEINQLKLLENLILHSCNLKSFESIGDFPYLKKINAEDNSITSLCGLKRVPSIEELELGNNHLRSLRGIGSLKNLKNLNVSCSKLKTLYGIKQLQNLETLSVSFNDLNSLKSLSGLRKLKQLYITHNRLNSLRYISTLPNLESLSVSSNKIKSISDLPNLQHLTYMDINNNQLRSFKGLRNLPNLEVLQACSNKITSFDGLEKSEELNFLYLSDNLIYTFEGLTNLPNLESLSLDHNDIESFFGLPRLEKLEQLNLKNNSLKSFEGFVNLPSLTSLNVVNNQIKSLKGMSSLEKLKKLNLENNHLSSLEHLPELPSLERLLLQYNSLETLDDLPELASLYYLDLAGNNLTSLKGISRLENLSCVKLKSNPLKSLDELLDLPCLESVIIDSKYNAHPIVLKLEEKRVRIHPF